MNPIVDIKSRNGKIYVKEKIGDKTKLTYVDEYPWYFYCDPLSPQDTKVIEKWTKAIDVHPSGLLKITCSNDSLSKWDLEKGKLDSRTIILKYLMDKKVKTYEADIDLWKRYLIDEDRKITSNPTVAMVDIETDDSQNGIEIGRDQILSFAVTINHKTYFYCDDSEYNVLMKIKAVFENVDIVCTWNGTNFDIPYILARFEHHGIKFWKSEIVHFDLMEIVKKKYKFSDQDPLTNFNLEYICQMFLGKGKVQHTEKIKWLYDHDREKLKVYNKQDCVLMDELNEKLGIMDLIIGVCVESVTPFRNHYISEIVDNYVLQEAKKCGRILPSNMWKLENRDGASDKKKFEGAIVFDVIPGLYENVSVYDFGAMYPNTIISWNIGIDTFLGKDIPEPTIPHTKTPSGCYFRTDIKSINAIVAEKLQKERDAVKAQMKLHDKNSIEYKVLNNKSDIIKVIGNSQYGAIGSQYTRYYSIESSESITLTAQYILKFTHKVLTQNGKQIIAGDTDSVFVRGI